MIREVFSRAAVKPEGPSGTDFLEAILRERPDLKDQAARFPSQGDYAHTVFIGDEVFKGPIEQSGCNDFDLEHKFLKCMEDKGLPIPCVTCVGKEFVFFGMTRIPGVRLERYDIGSFTAEEIRGLAKDIAGFMIGMGNAFSDEDAAAFCQVCRRSCPDPENIQRALGNPEIQKSLGRSLPVCQAGVEEYISILQNKKPVMGHDDLSPGNILVDPETKKLTGIVDFGLVRYSFPESHLLAFRSENSVFLSAVHEEYASQSGWGSKLGLFRIMTWAEESIGCVRTPNKIPLTLEILRHLAESLEWLTPRQITRPAKRTP